MEKDFEWEFDEGALVEIVSEGIPPNFTIKQPYETLRKVVLNGDLEGIELIDDTGEIISYIESYFKGYSGDLKEYLKKMLNGKIEEHKSEIILSKSSLKVLKQTNTDRANYVVHIRSLWNDYGEQHTT